MQLCNFQGKLIFRDFDISGWIYWIYYFSEYTEYTTLTLCLKKKKNPNNVWDCCLVTAYSTPRFHSELHGTNLFYFFLNTVKQTLLVFFFHSKTMQTCYRLKYQCNFFTDHRRAKASARQRLTGLVGALEGFEEALAQILRELVHLQIRVQEETEAFLVDALMDVEQKNRVLWVMNTVTHHSSLTHTHE